MNLQGLNMPNPLHEGSDGLSHPGRVGEIRRLDDED
jgi:hypothetical protein